LQPSKTICKRIILFCPFVKKKPLVIQFFSFSMKTVRKFSFFSATQHKEKEPAKGGLLKRMD